MSIAARRRVGLAGLLGLLAGALALMTTPGDPGALRLAGVGLFWWYGALAAPLAAALLTAGVRRALPRGEPAPGGSIAFAVAAWTSPMLLALVAARVFAGSPDAPAIALAVLVAPLIALLGASGDERPRPNIVAALATGAGVALILWANLLLLADVSGFLDLPRWAGSVVAAGLAMLVLALRGDSGVEAGSRRLTLVYGAGALGFLAAVALVALTVAVSPWGAWKDVASRPALTFGERNPWVTHGRTVAASTVLEFTEPHRVTALNTATYRVFEPGRFRESQLRAGESLPLRAGDRVMLEAGTRLRFEAGKRVPGTPASGIAWADPPERSALSTVAEAFGAVVTLVGGALALVASTGRFTAFGVSTGSGILLALVLGALCLGVYGAHAAPGIAIGAPAVAAVFDLPAAVVPGTPGRVLVVLTVLVLLLLFSATALAMRDVLGVAAGDASTGEARRTDARPALAGPTMTLLLAAACVASLWPGDASRALLTGLGLTASAAVAPRLAGDGPGARLAGSLVGVIAFAGLGALGSRIPAWAGVVVTYPALVAVPLAWGASRVWNAAASRR